MVVAWRFQVQELSLHLEGEGAPVGVSRACLRNAPGGPAEHDPGRADRLRMPDCDKDSSGVRCYSFMSTFTRKSIDFQNFGSGKDCACVDSPAL